MAITRMTHFSTATAEQQVVAIKQAMFLGRCDDIIRYNPHGNDLELTPLHAAQEEYEYSERNPDSESQMSECDFGSESSDLDIADYRMNDVD